MGLFDNILKKASKIVTNTILEDVKNTVKNNLNINSNTENTTNTVNTANARNTTNIGNTAKTTITTSKLNTIPEKYNIFPKYEGVMLGKPVEKSTPKYTRITIKYEGMPNANYISTLINSGFVQGSSIRYDKNNTYVIVNDIGNTTEIVYHIKK